jgi:hypothetical protein
MYFETNAFMEVVMLCDAMKCCRNTEVIFFQITFWPSGIVLVLIDNPYTDTSHSFDMSNDM